MNPVRQRLINSGLIKTPFRVTPLPGQPVRANPDAIKARDTNKCKVRKALAILERSSVS